MCLHVIWFMSHYIVSVCQTWSPIKLSANSQAWYRPQNWTVILFFLLLIELFFQFYKCPIFNKKMWLPISESSTNWGFCCLCGLQWPSSFTFSMNIFTEPSLWHFSFPSKIHLYFANYFEFGFLTLSQFLKSLASKNDLIKKNLELQESLSKLPARLNSNSFWPPSWGTLGSRTLKTLVEFKIYLLQRFLVICSQSKMNSMGNNKTRTERRPRLVRFPMIKE